MNVFCQIKGATSTDPPDTPQTQDIHSSHPDVVQSCHDYENELVLEALGTENTSECSLLDEVLGAVKNTTSHYYHTYDVSLREKTSAATSDSSERNANMMLVAAPYNVVDVIGTQNDMLSKPRVPQTKPDSFITGRGAATKKSMFHGDVIRATSPAVIRNKITMQANEPLVPDSYEEIDVPTERPMELITSDNIQGKQNKSTTMKAKLAALHDLDISKQTDISISDCEVSPSIQKKELGESPSKPTGKQKKGFFSRWLRKGSQNNGVQSSLDGSVDSKVTMGSDGSCDSSQVLPIVVSSPRTDPCLMSGMKSDLSKHLCVAVGSDNANNEQNCEKLELSMRKTDSDVSSKKKEHEVISNEDKESSTLTRQSMRRSKRTEKIQKPASTPPQPPSGVADTRPSSSLRSSTPPGKRTSKPSPTKHITVHLHGDVIRNSIDKSGKL